MSHPWKFLKVAGKAVVKHCGNAIGLGIAGDVLVAIVDDIWDAWGKKSKDEERRAEIEAVAQAAAKEVVQQVAQVVQEVAGDQSQEFQRMLETYLAQVPAMVQKSMRRQSDPTGRSVPADLVPRKAEDLLAYLPPKLPRFKPGDHFLDYELQQLLGVGGFGEVWKARNPLLDGFVALKFCLDSNAKDQLLRHEAAVLSQVMRQGKHQGIVQLLRTYLKADPPCLEYEYVEDGDLAGLIKEKKPKPEIVAKIILRLADIVGFAHRLNPPVVHRDLKPANILVQQTSDAKIVLKVADFGIGGLAATQAIREESQGTSRGKFLVSALQGAYTPLYASPQQMRGDAPDPRDDVFSLGVIWYQMLIGNLVTGRPGGRRWRDKLADGMPSKMLDLLEACFEDDPNDRPANAADLAEGLGSMLGETKQPKTRSLETSATYSAPTTPRQKSQSKPLVLPKLGDTITSSLGMRFAWIPPGSFLMGSPYSESERGADESQHKVTLTKGFYLGVCQVTQEQWEAIMGNNPSHFKGKKNLPVENVSWEDCREFLERFSEKEGQEYRLATEAEWEFACRAGTTTAFCFGDTISTDQANYDGNFVYFVGKKGEYRQKTTPVGSFPPNAWGLYDLHGNVWEWCADWYGDHPTVEVVDPPGAPSGESRVLRGGSFRDYPKVLRSAARNKAAPTYASRGFGFRVARYHPA